MMQALARLIDTWPSWDYEMRLRRNTAPAWTKAPWI
jgi:hypothetical protein